MSRLRWNHIAKLLNEFDVKISLVFAARDAKSTHRAARRRGFLFVR